MEVVTDFIFLGSKITADNNCSYEIKRCLLLGRKAMTSLDSILKSRDITLLTKVYLVKAMLFPVVMYGCESWTIKKVVVVQSLSHVQLFVTPWAIACQAPLSMGFPRQEHWSERPFPSPGVFLTQGSNLSLLHCQVGSLPLSHQGSHRIGHSCPFYLAK